MDYLPIFLDIRDRHVVIVGGGHAAARKAEYLLRSGGRLTVVAPEICEELHALARQGGLRYLGRRFRAADLDGAACVIAATGDRAVDRRVYAAAGAARVPVNVVDQPSLSTFIVPSIVDRSPIVIAISSGGTAPVLARNLRARLEGQIPHNLGRLAAIAGAFRARVRSAISDPVSRRRFWEAAFEGPAAEAALAGREAEAAARLSALLSNTESDASEVGAIYHVAVTSPDPDLLTFRALRLMQRADLVVHDDIPAAILALARRDAHRMGPEALPPTDDALRALVIDRAQSGLCVLRLTYRTEFRDGEDLRLKADAARAMLRYVDASSAIRRDDLDRTRRHDGPRPAPALSMGD